MKTKRAPFLSRRNKVICFSFLIIYRQKAPNKRTNIQSYLVQQFSECEISAHFKSIVLFIIECDLCLFALLGDADAFGQPRGLVNCAHVGDAAFQRQTRLRRENAGNERARACKKFAFNANRRL